jgi:two-component system phosphate regulon sensor histidine kinase PhoR
MRFEFSIGSGNKQLASRGFTKKLTDDPGILVFYYVFPKNGKKSLSTDLLTVVIPVWKKFAFKEIDWLIAASVFLTIMIAAIFCYFAIWGEWRQQLFYDKRSVVIKNMIQQLETPLSTVSVAAEALRNAQVMLNAEKTNYYQQVINEQNKRMNEHVEKILRELE